MRSTGKYMRRKKRNFICQSTLRRIMTLPSTSLHHVILLGIDDWSFRRGRNFGTILVDLISHTILDLLPDRKAETAAAWMRRHPEIKIVSRDRGGEYASAATAGAPQAIQCADRFHILKNLGEALEGLLARHLVTKRKEKVQEILDEHTPAWQPTRSAKRSPTLERLQQARREGRLALYDQVVA
jgi:transposase